jgi:hypothetical protein
MGKREAGAFTQPTPEVGTEMKSPCEAPFIDMVMEPPTWDVTVLTVGADTVTAYSSTKALSDELPREDGEWQSLYNPADRVLVVSITLLEFTT